MISSAKKLCLLLVLSMGAGSALANSYADAIRSFNDAGESAEYFKSAYGYAVFPSIGKAGMGIGAAHGQGRVFVGTRHVGNSSMTQLTMGIQLGGQVYSQIIFFEHEQAFKDFTTGNFEFSAQATAVAITAGASAEANTGGGVAAGVSGGRNDARTVHAGYRKGMAVFTIAKGGLMFEAALGGQKFTYQPL
ncbi:MAG: lipid-binding SYLF domain-containing protein [Gammaproteobacteria bacterium]|jgi:lipid-binding SYLF domain-containing protein|nr:lipid-binding SYLF domain-containing protein [Gammaproteobacteria bacterium]